MLSGLFSCSFEFICLLFQEIELHTNLLWWNQLSQVKGQMKTTYLMNLCNPCSSKPPGMRSILPSGFVERQVLKCSMHESPKGGGHARQSMRSLNEWG